MASRSLSSADTDNARIDRAVRHFVAKRHLFERLAESLVLCFNTSPELASLIHSTRVRVKDSDSLRAKLGRIRRDIDESNLFHEITDLAGVRLIHLHTEQVRTIHPLIVDLLSDENYEVRSTVAYCWDVEYEELFQEMGIRTQPRESLYTTIHYDVQANNRMGLICELQVRSLMDEVWSEVSHSVNYPEPSSSRACQDQLKVLARLTTGGSRLIDSIFRSHGEKS